MPVFYFSEEFKARARATIAPLSVRVIREVEDSPTIYVEELRCERCGFTRAFKPPKETQATAIHDCEWTHRYVWDTGEICGGQIAFVTSAEKGLIPCA